MHRLAEILLEINGGGVFAVREFPGERKKIDVGNYYADDRLIRRTLGWKPRVDVRAALHLGPAGGGSDTTEAPAGVAQGQT